jgi:hypothetical protein
VERSARFVAVFLLRHGGPVADEFSESCDRLFAGIIVAPDLCKMQLAFERIS